MNISELIEHLESLKQEHGDIKVLCVGGNYDWVEEPVSKEKTKAFVAEDWECEPGGILDNGEKYIMINC